MPYYGQYFMTKIYNFSILKLFTNSTLLSMSTKIVYITETIGGISRGVGVHPLGLSSIPLRVLAPPEILRTPLENEATTNIFTINDIFHEHVFILHTNPIN